MESSKVFLASSCDFFGLGWGCHKFATISYDPRPQTSRRYNLITCIVLYNSNNFESWLNRTTSFHLMWVSWIWKFIDIFSQCQRTSHRLSCCVSHTPNLISIRKSSENELWKSGRWMVDEFTSTSFSQSSWFSHCITLTQACFESPSRSVKVQRWTP